MTEPQETGARETEPAEAVQKGTSLWADAGTRLLRNRAALAGAGVVLFMASIALTFEPLSAHFTRFSFDEQHHAREPKPVGAVSIPAHHYRIDEGGKAAFAEIDTDADGKLSRAELSLHLKRRQFAAWDTDGDGALVPAEIREASVNLVKRSPRLTVFTNDFTSGAFVVKANPGGPIELTLGENRVRVTAGVDASSTAAAVARAINDDLVAASTVVAEARAGKVHLTSKRPGKRALLMLESSDPGVVPEGTATDDGGVYMSGDMRISFDEARHKDVDITSIFPESEAMEFVRAHDVDKDEGLSAAEFPGLPRPEVHWFGTDQLGRDLLTRCIMGARVSLAVGFIATFVSFLIGVLWGATAGFLGGKVDNLMMRFVDVMYGLPFMFLVILLMVIFQDIPSKNKLYLLFMALGAVQWLTMSRIVRGQVISLKHREFVEAARAIGVRKRTIITRHLIPNALGPIIVYSTLTVPAVMLEEAFLSFLGLGVQAPYASWGSLAAEGAKGFEFYPWMIIFPGGLLAVTLLSLNFLGDGLRDALDPQVRKD